MLNRVSVVVSLTAKFTSMISQYRNITNFINFKMSFDSEEARLVDHIQASAFFQAKEAAASFITKKMGRRTVTSMIKMNQRKLEQNVNGFYGFFEMGSA